jgi:alpha-1,4-digalacturonate transport system substrate-binding protein
MTGMKMILATLAVALATSTSALAGEVRVLWYSDGVEGEVMADLLKRFEKDNPDVKITLDNVAYNVIKEQLPVQLEAGSGPDIARVTDLKALAGHWLDLRPLIKDAAYWEENFGAQLDWMRPDGSDIIPGFMTQLTLTGGFANKTLFEQAGVAIPDKKATWEDWAKAAKAVMDSQQTPMAMAMDRSGHRFTGPAISMGAKLIGTDGMPAVIDDGFKAMATQFVDWNNSGLMSKEVWVSASGTTYRAAVDDFINGQLPYYYSGSWQIPNLSTKIGDAFDWVATGSPCGPGGCAALPGGAGLVAIKYTKNPADVARVMDYLASADVVKEFTERTLFLPAHKAVAAGELDFKTDDANAKAALKSYVIDSTDINPLAAKTPAWKWSSVVFGAIVSRIGQATAGEMSLDDAYARIEEDIKQKVAEASK